MRYRVTNLWSDRSVDLPDDEALWRFAQEEFPELMLRVPTDTADLVRHIDSMQNWRVTGDAPPPAVEHTGLDRILQAAAIAGGDPHAPQHRAARVAFEDDPEGFALAAAGAPVDAAARAALRGLLAAQAGPIEKAEAAGADPGPPPEGEVRAPVADGAATAAAVHRALNAGREAPLRLGGRHSAGSWLATDPDTGKKFLLKPGSGRQSPAAGAAEEPASQSRREAAYWHALDAMGLGAWAPRADLITIAGREYAAIAWLPPGDWRPIGDAYREDPVKMEHALAPYLADGTLHRLAAADFILGNPDRHDANILWNGAQMRLIDHGSALAGDGFDPAHDAKSYVPWYLRFWAGPTWAALVGGERTDVLPVVSERVDVRLLAWLDHLDGVGVQAVLTRYGVMTAPTVARLEDLRIPPPPAAQTINVAWTTGLE